MSIGIPSAKLTEEEFEDLLEQVLINQSIEGIDLSPEEVTRVREKLRLQHNL